MKTTTFASIGIIYFLIVLTINISVVSAAVFNVTTVIGECTSLWYCTNYSQEICGSRVCIDTNGCGVNTGKPEEFLLCSESTKNGGHGGGKSVTPIFDYNATDNALPQGYFTINTELIKLNVEQGALIQRIISVESEASSSYKMSILYPLSYSSNNNFITTSIADKYIETKDTFNLIIDAKNMSVGTYVAYIVINNKYYSKNITLVIDVLSKSQPLIVVDLDSNLKFSGLDKYITSYVGMRDINASLGDAVTLSILDPKGNILSSKTTEVTDPLNIMHKMLIPENASEGYYTIAVSVDSGGKKYIRSTTFTLLSQNKYSPILEMPGKNPNAIIIIGLLIILVIFIISALILLNMELFYKYNLKNNLPEELTIFKSLSNKAATRIKSSFGKKYSKKYSNTTQKNSNITSELNLLKRSYDKGFITLSEYRDALRRRGYTVEKEIIIWPQGSTMPEVLKREGITGGSISDINQELQSKNIQTSHLANVIPNRILLDLRTTIDKAFILNNSQTLFSLQDLLDVLPHMSEHVFHHHLMHGRNDFADWTRNVFGYNELSEQIRNAKSKEALIQILSNYR